MLAVGLWRQKAERASERVGEREGRQGGTWGGGGMYLSFMRLPKPLRFLVAHSLLTRAPAVMQVRSMCVHSITVATPWMDGCAFLHPWFVYHPFRDEVVWLTLRCMGEIPKLE
jgi:hypothetical protein